LPSILVKGCSTAEIIQEDENGLLAEETPEAWANAIIRAIQDKELMQKLSQNAYKQLYRTWDDVAEEVYAFYQKIINQKK
jgi:glycosyltransferase involved in cell wall biosynthesis